MSSILKTVAVVIVSAVVAIGGFLYARDPGQPTATCQGKVMRAGDTCVLTSASRYEERTLAEQAEAQRSALVRYGLGAGIAGSIVFVCAAGYLVILVMVRREEAREAARPYLGLRKKLAEENGWRFVADDPAILQAYPAKARTGKTDGRFTEVLRGDLDGCAFEAFDHHYQEYDRRKGPIAGRQTVFLFHHPGLVLDEVSVFVDQVFPYTAAPLVLTVRLQGAMRHLGITHFTLFGGTVVVTRPVIPDHATDKLLGALRALRVLLDQFPVTALDRTRA